MVQNADLQHRKLLAFKASLGAYPEIDARLRIDGEHATGLLENGQFVSRFSAVHHLDLHTGVTHPCGWRGTTIATDKAAVLVSSSAFFANLTQPSLLIALDRLTRTLHAINFFSSDRSGLLFVPVHASLLKNVREDHGKYFSSVLISLGLNPSRVVIELPASTTDKKASLAFLAGNYRRHGFRIGLQLNATEKTWLPWTALPVDYLLGLSAEDIPAQIRETSFDSSPRQPRFVIEE